ncbi:MAG TPA: hypothetical protein VEW05_03785 [Candidatus Polarisedimenticolia bacterium]|nr:hypothetical protein [Candidatus Polarisedimenticolia bacterium]
MTKTTTTLNTPPSARSESPRQAQWKEARAVFPIYLALAKQLELEIPFTQAKRSLPEKPDLEIFSQVHEWLDSMDQRVMVHQLRHLLQMTTLNASETGLRALIQRHLRKTKKSTVDRDKIDFLLVQYFALCAPAKIYHKQIEPGDVAHVMEPVLGEVDPAPLAWCAPLEQMLESLSALRGLREILKTNFIEQGRKVKETAGGMFYDPAALVAFIRFNFLLRRTLIELMHADLIAIRAGLSQLQSAGVRTIDCHHFGLSSSEPLTKISAMADEWKQPFQKDYTERSVSQAFDKLLGLRADVEQALEKALGKTSEQLPAQAPKSAPALKKASAGPTASNANPKPRERSAAPGAAEPDSVVALDFENCMEQIWEQLIATPPTRGRSMTTVKIGGARILLSSWEVTAFVSEDGPSAEDLRRAVVARVLVTAAMESAKETGNATSLDRAMNIARVEVTRLQERVDVAKQAKDTEAAVNLGISTKRLLSTLDEAEKL